MATSRSPQAAFDVNIKLWMGAPMLAALTRQAAMREWSVPHLVRHYITEGLARAEELARTIRARSR